MNIGLGLAGDEESGHGLPHLSLVRYTERLLLHLRRLALLGVACRVVGARARAPTPALALHLLLLLMFLLAAP